MKEKYSWCYCLEIKLWSTESWVLIEECKKKDINTYQITTHSKDFKSESTKFYELGEPKKLGQMSLFT